MSKHSIKRPPFRATATPARDTHTLTMRQSSLERHATWFEASLPELLAAEKVPVWQPDQGCTPEVVARLRAQIGLLQRELCKAEGWDSWDGEEVNAVSLWDLAAAEPPLHPATQLAPAQQQRRPHKSGAQLQPQGEGAAISMPRGSAEQAPGAQSEAGSPAERHLPSMAPCELRAREEQVEAFTEQACSRSSRKAHTRVDGLNAGLASAQVAALDKQLAWARREAARQAAEAEAATSELAAAASRHQRETHRA